MQATNVSNIDLKNFSDHILRSKKKPTTTGESNFNYIFNILYLPIIISTHNQCKHYGGT